MEAIMIKRPETVALTYDKSNPIAKKTLDFFLSLGIFHIEKTVKSMTKSMQKALEEEKKGHVTKLVNHKNAVAEILG